MSTRRIQLLAVVLVGAACAWAQEPPDTRVCTDLSGKIRLACPHEGPVSVGPASPAEATTRPEPTPVTPAKMPSGATVRNVADATAAPYGETPAVVASGVSQTGFSQQSLERSFARDFVSDQKGIWTSPLKLRLRDTEWLVPLVGTFTIVTLSDGSIERKLPTSPSFIKNSKTFSDYGAAAYAGVVGSAYLLSRATNNDHMRETAVLSAEAALHSLLITEGVKYVAGRQRPLEGDGTGSFRMGGSSFPSLHSAGAWAIASVVAREYPGPLTQFLAYGGAAAISAARVTGRQHFASDALVGSAIGWYVGRHVYNAHQDRDADRAYGVFERDRSGDAAPNPSRMGSAYVPLDSWVYPAMDRLAALGYIRTAFAGMRPWTRMECARLIGEAEANIQADNLSDEPAVKAFQALSKEFAAETRRWAGAGNVSGQIDSVYTRFTGISGTPLADGFHFGQTIVNDYGRPYGEGFNAVAGFSASGTAGPMAVYVRGEYQHAPPRTPVPTATLQAIANADGLPSFSYPAMAGDQFRLLDTYAAFNFSGFTIAVGKQSLWFSPDRHESLLFGNNAEPMLMARLSRNEPVRLPSLFRYLGPVRTEFVFGRLAGHRSIVSHGQLFGPAIDDQPFLEGQKFSFKPTPNLEFGFATTALIGGPQYPINFHNVWHGVFSFSNAYAGTDADPGDRRSSFDFTYRIPWLRNWLTLYADSMTDDEYSPIAYPRRSAIAPGIFLSRVPKLRKMDFRVEGTYTDLPGLRPTGFFYFNNRYHDGYTNAGNLIAGMVGRDGRGGSATARYWFSGRDVVQVSYRHVEVDKSFLEGGRMHDAAISSQFTLRPDLSVEGKLQYENWRFPVISAVPQSNVSVSFQFTFEPWKK